jgi:hypothetical protein
LDEEANFAALKSAGMQKGLGKKKNLGSGVSGIPDKLAKDLAAARDNTKG